MLKLSWFLKRIFEEILGKSNGSTSGKKVSTGRKRLETFTEGGESYILLSFVWNWKVFRSSITMKVIKNQTFLITFFWLKSLPNKIFCLNRNTELSTWTTWPNLISLSLKPHISSIQILKLNFIDLLFRL